ncbi:hypothetical protein AB6E89_08350 [Vibrio breoganii]
MSDMSLQEQMGSPTKEQMEGRVNALIEYIYVLTKLKRGLGTEAQIKEYQGKLAVLRPKFNHLLYDSSPEERDLLVQEFSKMSQGAIDPDLQLEYVAHMESAVSVANGWPANHKNEKGEVTNFYVMPIYFGVMYVGPKCVELDSALADTLNDVWKHSGLPEAYRAIGGVSPMVATSLALSEPFAVQTIARRLSVGIAKNALSELKFTCTESPNLDVYPDDAHVRRVFFLPVPYVTRNPLDMGGISDAYVMSPEARDLVNGVVEDLSSVVAERFPRIEMMTVPLSPEKVLGHTLAWYNEMEMRQQLLEPYLEMDPESIRSEGYEWRIASADNSFNFDVFLMLQKDGKTVDAIRLESAPLWTSLLLVVDRIAGLCASTGLELTVSDGAIPRAYLQKYEKYVAQMKVEAEAENDDSE